MPFDPAIAPAESDLEVELIRALRGHGLPEPVRQHPLEIAGRRFRLDVAYPDARELRVLGRSTYR
jgi:hypothetical protein